MRLAALLMTATAFASAAMAQQAPPPTQPAAEAPKPASAPLSAVTKVIVLPFEQLGGIAGNYDWVGRALQQNLVTELGRSNMLELISLPQSGSRPVADAKAAIEAGKAAGADAVVFGSYQLLEPDLRINGMVVDVGTGETLGTLKSTGTVRDLFTMEDTVATQAKRMLVSPVYQTAELPLAVPAQPQQQQPQQPAADAPAPTPLQQPTNSFANDYNRYTYYPNNAYGYGYYGYGYGSPYSYGYGYGGPGYGGYCPPSYPCYPGYYGGYGGYGGGYAPYYPVVINTQLGSFAPRFQRPIGVGTSAGMVASGMVSVPGNFLPNGRLAR